MPLLGEHEVVGNANRNGFRQDYGIGEEGIKGAETANIEIDVDASIVVKDEIAYHVCSLNGICIPIKGVQEPGIILCDELASGSVCPEHVFAVHVEPINSETIAR